MHEILKGKKHIFFDVGYTLDKPVTGDWFFTNKFYEYTKDKLSRIDEKEFLDARKEGIKYVSSNHLVKGIVEEIEGYKHFYKIINDILKLELTDEIINEISIDRATNMHNYIAYDDAKEVLKELSKNYTLGIISDTWPSIVDQLKYIGVYEYISTFTFSCDFGVFKPHPIMYEDALKKCKVDAKDTVFVDDSLSNLEGAVKFGITPVLICANPVSDVETNYTKIYSLKELIK